MVPAPGEVRQLGAAVKYGKWLLDEAGVKRELLDAVEARKLA